MEVMSLRNLGFDPNLLETLHDLLDISDEQNQQSYQAPSRRYVREAKAMAATPADVKETKDAYVFVVDVPGLRPDRINVEIEEDNVLVVSGERKKEKERDQGIKYLRMERSLGKYLKKFVLPDNADIERISAECQDGVLTVTVAKKPPPEQKKPKIIQIQISSNQGGGQGGKGGQGWEEGGEEERGKQGGGQGWEHGRQGGGQGGEGGQGWEEGGQKEHGRQGRGQGDQGGGQGGKGGQGWGEGGQEERGRQGGEQGGEHGRQGGQSGGERGAGGYEGQVEGRDKTFLIPFLLTHIINSSYKYPEPPPSSVTVTRFPLENSQKPSNRNQRAKIPPTKKRRMDLRIPGLEAPLFSTLQHIMDAADDAEKSFNAPTRTYVRDAKAMASTPADVKEYPNSYVFVVDMPGLKSGDIKVQVENDNVLLISGERKREEEKEGAKYVRMERRVGKFMRKFVLPENANVDAISAVCQDGVLTVTVQKLPPPEPKKPKTIEVKIG
ncbi:hypothetical protein ACFX2C_043089 [Malus domestica]